MMTIQSMDDVRGLLRELPGPDNSAAAKAAQREATLTKPAGSLGRLEDLVELACAWQGHHPPSFDRRRMAIFAGNHGITAEGVSAFPADVTAQMVANFNKGGAAINQLCAAAGLDLKIYPLELDTPTGNFVREPAMTEDECVGAMALGMSAVEDGLDILCLGEMGIGNTTAAAALCHGIFAGDAENWVGPGTGVRGEALANKIRVVRDAVALHSPQVTDGLDALCRVGGREIAAMAGAILAARFARVPVILDGYVCCAAAACLFAVEKSALDHCVVGHVSAEPGHRHLLEALGQRPLLDLDMRLGEGSGAALALMIVQAAMDCHNGMATFDEAGVSGNDGY
jgi:nicotinate-nucleotide--dimethylbenzimidazole phosphoribosyltransferase